MKIWESIKNAFLAVAVIYDESKNIDEYGDWERHRLNNEERRKKKLRDSHR
mgnify:CR=1 FL=1